MTINHVIKNYIKNKQKNGKPRYTIFLSTCIAVFIFYLFVILVSNFNIIGNEKITWGSVNRKFIELEKIRANIFIKIKEKSDQ